MDKVTGWNGGLGSSDEAKTMEYEVVRVWNPASYRERIRCV